MATFHYKLDEVMAMPFCQFAELHGLIDAVNADKQLQRPPSLVADHMYLLVPAAGSLAKKKEMDEGLHHMRKIRETRNKR